MRTYDEIYTTATARSPFSNGTSGEMWMGSWCYRCKVDGPFQREQTDQGCPILLAALMQRTPTEWTETGLQDYTCSEFQRDDEGGGGEPAPCPTPPAEIDGQTDLFAVFADQIADATSTLAGAR